MPLGVPFRRRLPRRLSLHRLRGVSRARLPHLDLPGLCQGPRNLLLDCMSVMDHRPVSGIVIESNLSGAAVKVTIAWSHSQGVSE
ncbi:hypothetical protein DPEC_G00311940 [Dallia pectoralis]|uniref:Uncharacterized protein n=1 Tax=Dallia pectoralis TaxID=75939 RepID=A0ACC2FBJ2_DALPE|nr:hypothetical protein DPEC_G00311940 [Dallia pectoralis]